MALLEHIACGDTSIAAPINNVEEKIGELSKFDPETNKTGFQLQFEVCKYWPYQKLSMYVIIYIRNLYGIAPNKLISCM